MDPQQPHESPPVPREDEPPPPRQRPLPSSSHRRRDRLGQWTFEFRPHEGRWAAHFRTCCRIVIIMLREFQLTAIPLRASALTYSITLSLVPILAMSTAILKGYGSDNDLKIAAYRLIDRMVPHFSNAEMEVTPQSAPAPDASAAPAPPRDEGAFLTDQLRSGVDAIFHYVDRTNFATLGAFGIIGLLYAVILVMGTIEAAMNAIWHSERGRSLSRKIMDYLALIILLPISVNIALAGDAILASPTMINRLNLIMPSLWLIKMIFKFFPFLFIVLTLTIMYRFFPNVRVRMSAALSGAIFGAICWFLGQRLYIFAQIGVAKYNAIYGSFATVPLFLIWVNLGWTFILLGASLAYAVQNRQRYCPPGRKNSPQRNLQLAFDILEMGYEDFARGTPTTFEKILQAQAREQPGNIKQVLEELIEGGLLHRLESSEPSFSPALPAPALKPREVVRLFLGHEELPSSGGHFSRLVILAAEEAIATGAFPPPRNPALCPDPGPEQRAGRTL